MYFSLYQLHLMLLNTVFLFSVPAFGIDISAQFDVHMQLAPSVVLKCIEAVESRGKYSPSLHLSLPHSIPLSLPLFLPLSLPLSPPVSPPHSLTPSRPLSLSPPLPLPPSHPLAGIHLEGIYRISPAVALVNKLRAAFDKGNIHITSFMLVHIYV